MMTDLLLIIFTLALLFLSHLMRLLLAVRFPSSLKFKPVGLSQPPDIMADLFDRTDRDLAALGFEHSGWASIQTTPSLPGFLPPLIRLYHHRTRPIVARVSPPYNLFAGDHCQVVFLSRSRDKVYLATANRVPELFPRPSESVSIMLNTRVDSLAEQFQAHSDEMARRKLDWHDRSARLGAQTWSLHLVNRYEQKSIQWILGEGFVKPVADGTNVPRIGIVLRFLWRFFSGQEKNPPHELQAIPARRAAYLFGNWQQALRMAPPLSVQLGIFFVSSLAFVVLAGVFWAWDFALLILGVILFHEAGHWLAMRLLGYRNLQILMLPLVGGVTIGQEETGRAAHRVLVSLMGPLPGILLGFVILGFYGAESGWVTTLGLTLLIVNYLNLLPILPLDGGQLLKALIPVRRFALLIGFEWMGAAALLLTGWLIDSYFLAALALVPLLSGLALLKRKQVIGLLEGVTDGAATPSPQTQAAAVIHAIDHSDKHYRPLEKKAREISEILAMLRLKPAAPAVAGAFLATYIGLFVAPPVALLAAFPETMELVALLGSDFDAQHQAAYDHAIRLPMPQLVRELSASTQRQIEHSAPTFRRPLLASPATAAAIAAAEQRLATAIDGEYREFLATSNGLIGNPEHPEGVGYQLYPVDKVTRFGELLSEIQTRLRRESPTPGEPLLVHLWEAGAEEEYSEQTLQPAQLAQMLLIGSRLPGEYLLLDPAAGNAGPARVILLSEIAGSLSGKRFQSLRDYLADDLALKQIIAAAPAD